MPDIFDQLASDPGDAAQPNDIFGQIANSPNEFNWGQFANARIQHAREERQASGGGDLSIREQEAIMDAWRMEAGLPPTSTQPDRGIIAAQARKNRDWLDQARAGAFGNLTDVFGKAVSIADPQLGSKISQGHDIVTNPDPSSFAFQAGGFAEGMGEFALSAPYAIAKAGLVGAGSQREEILAARQQGGQIGGGTELLETAARGIIDSALTAAFVKTGGKAASVVQSLIQPSVKQALAEQGLDTARKLAGAWVKDSIKTGALSEVQYLADIGLGHLANPNIKPTAAEAAKAAAFGIILPPAMGLVSGIAGRVQPEKAPSEPAYHTQMELGQDRAIQRNAAQIGEYYNRRQAENEQSFKDFLAGPSPEEIAETTLFEGGTIPRGTAKAQLAPVPEPRPDSRMFPELSRDALGNVLLNGENASPVDTRVYPRPPMSHQEALAREIPPAGDQWETNRVAAERARIDQEFRNAQEGTGAAVAATRSPGDEITKQQIGTDANGRKIMLVNGDEVKTKLNMDFVEGDNGQHSGYIPKDEVWVDANLRPSQYGPVATHESTEAQSMSKGQSYEEAHKGANEVEKGIRETAQPSQVIPSPYAPPEPMPKLPEIAEKPSLARQIGQQIAKFHENEQGAIEIDKFLTILGGKDAISAAKTAVDVVTSAASDLQKVLAPTTRGEVSKKTEAILRQENARAARARDIRVEALRGADAGLKLYGKAHGQKALDDFMDAINEGKKQADPALQPIADALDAERRAKVAQMKALGTGATEKFDEDWFGRQWENPELARQFFGGRRSLTGPKTFLKERTLESVAEGRAAGLKLITDNPVEMHIRKMGEMDKYIAGVNGLNNGIEAGIVKRVKSGETAPADWKQIHQQIGLYKAKNPVTGEMERGTFWAHPQFADLVNNHLSPGLQGHAWFQAYLGAANWQNQLQLGLSGFHVMFTSGDAVISQVAKAWMQLLNYRDVVGFIKDQAFSPAAAITNYLRGGKGLQEWKSPGSTTPTVARIVNILTDAGARGHMDSIYRTHVSDKFMKALHEGNVLGTVLRAPFALAELPTRFIMENIVPRQKWGVAMDLVSMEMKHNPGISDEALTAKARKIWDSADNRMGQLVYDNLFWNKLTKDIAMATVRSVGWNLGTFREIGGGAFDLLKIPIDRLRGKNVELSYRAAYMMGLFQVTASTGALITYLFTGERPKDMRDLFFPRTGGVDEQGRPSRISLPTYMKDIYHFANEPGKTLANKVHPALTTLHDMWLNKDFYGTKIYNEDDPLVQKLLDTAKYVGGTAEPLSSRNLRRSLSAGESIPSALKSFVGVTPAPAAIGKTAFEQSLTDLAAEQMPVGGRTKEAAEKATLKQQVERFLAKGDSGPLNDAANQGKITSDEARQIIKQSQMSPLERSLSKADLAAAVSRLHLATADERAKAAPILMKRISEYFHSGLHTVAEKQKMLELYQKNGLMR